MRRVSVSTMPVTLLLLGSLFLATASALAQDRPAPGAPPSAAEILSRVKEATGGKAWDAVRTLHTKAAIVTGGLSGTVESWDDALKGRFVDEITLGPIRQAQGFDGETVWLQDSSRQARKEEGGDERAGAANDAYRRCLAYFFPERWPATIETAGEKDEGGRKFRIIRMSPKGGRPFDVWVDAATHLIDRAVEKAALETRTTFLSDYRLVDGLRLPFAARSTNGETKYDQVVTVQSIERNLPIDEGRFRMPGPPPPDFTFADNRTSATLPFDLANNHIYVDVRLNGKGPFRMLFDSGGANIVTPDVARGLGLKSEGALQGRGVGEKSEDVALTRVDSVRVGDVEVAHQVFAVFPLDALSQVEGVPAAGLIGYEVFKRFVVRVEYDQGRMTLTDPAAFRYEGPGTIVPFQFNGHIPQVEGEIDGLPGKFDIDTGSRASLTLLAPFVEKHGLKERYRAQLEAVTGWGVGGPARGLLTRAGSIRLGPIKVERPVTELSLQTKGAFTDPYVAGNIGGGILKRFNIVFDYANQRLIFEPNANGSKPDIYDRSGLWLNRAADGFEVANVVPGGPAAEAALKTGDLILAVDGRKAVELTLPDLRDRLRADPPGTRVKLTVRSGEATRDVVLTLRDLV